MDLCWRHKIRADTSNHLFQLYTKCSQRVNVLHLYGAFSTKKRNLPLIHPFTHIHSPMSVHASRWPTLREQLGVQCPAHEHFDMWRGGARDETL